MTLKLGSTFTLDAVEGLRVSDLAERAGIAPSTIRFYERAGLLSHARRAENGYRVFAESALEELAFISRAKGIGMSLEGVAGRQPQEARRTHLDQASLVQACSPGRQGSGGQLDLDRPRRPRVHRRVAGD